jgi:hypothetical protein
MGFRRVSYLIPCCDGCGLAWSFADPACPDGIPPHYASRVEALAGLPARYGWRVTSRRTGWPAMTCRRCAAAGVRPEPFLRGWLTAGAAWARRLVPSGPVLRPFGPDLAPGHPESAGTALPPEQQDLLAALDDDLFPDL